MFAVRKKRLDALSVARNLAAFQKTLDCNLGRTYHEYMEKNVTIYTTPTCAFCKLAKEFFQTHGVPYRERDVVSDAAAREDAIRKSGQLGVPVIDIDGQIVIGFDRGKLRELLGVE